MRAKRHTDLVHRCGRRSHQEMEGQAHVGARHRGREANSSGMRMAANVLDDADRSIRAINQGNHLGPWSATEAETNRKCSG